MTYTAAMDQLLTRNEVAERLSVSPRTVLRLSQQGALPSVKLGKAVRYRPADIEALINDSTLKRL